MYFFAVPSAPSFLNSSNHSWAEKTKSALASVRSCPGVGVQEGFFLVTGLVGGSVEVGAGWDLLFSGGVREDPIVCDGPLPQPMPVRNNATRTPKKGAGSTLLAIIGNASCGYSRAEVVPFPRRPNHVKMSVTGGLSLMW